MRSFVTCGRCHGVFDPGGADTPLPCPYCGEAGQSATTYTVKPPEPAPVAVEAEPACPGCGAAMGKDAVVCVECGYHRGTGEQLRTVFRTGRRVVDASVIPLPARLAIFAFLEVFFVFCCLI